MNSVLVIITTSTGYVEMHEIEGIRDKERAQKIASDIVAVQTEAINIAAFTIIKG
jgi:hypothetical protein